MAHKTSYLLSQIHQPVFTRVAKEISSARKKIPLIRDALSIEVTFNGPIGKAERVVYELADKERSDPGRSPSFFKRISMLYDAALILPVKKEKPVVVLKRLGQSLSGVRLTMSAASDQFYHSTLSHFICWKGELWGKFPQALCKQHSREEMGKLYAGDYSLNVSTGAIELPLGLLLGETKMKLKGSGLLRDTRDCLRILGVLPERRGKMKKPSPIKLEIQAFLITKAREGISSGKRYSLDQLLDLLSNHLNEKYPDTPHTLPDASTVSRLLKRHGILSRIKK